MKVVDRKVRIDKEPKLFGENHAFGELKRIESNGEYEIFTLNIPQEYTKQALSVCWKIPALNIKGTWSSNLILDKRIRADWEVPQLSSSISIDAPILSIFGQDDENILCFACSDAVNHIDFEAGLREEDNHIYCSITFFADDNPHDSDYNAKIYINKRSDNFSHIIQEASSWVSDQNLIKQPTVPEGSRVPLYSTWYSYHQDVNEASLLDECVKSKALGYELIIVDDGWQTLDGGRGYDFTGDWEADRFEDMAGFVQNVHDIDMKIMLWYSVPFCGIKSKAYQKFKGKFLTENHHWAPVFDIRFPEVRQYMVNKYTEALINWKIDGFKLDFIDDFKLYPESEINALNGRDTLSVPKAVQTLIGEIAEALHTIKPDVLIEFRQKYISPALRQLGNMFRAFDCPNDSLMNRVRTTDVKLLCGESAVHSDMFTWHPEETIEVAALQITSILFSVPQISVRLSELSDDHLAMVQFYTAYWNNNKEVLLDGEFTAYKPLSNYPILTSTTKDKWIGGVYEDTILDLDKLYPSMDIINGKTTENIYVKFDKTPSVLNYVIVNCKGEIILEKKELNPLPVMHFKVPANGMIQIKF